MRTPDVIREIVRRFQELDAILADALTGFEPAAGERVKCMAVAEHVAKRRVIVNSSALRRKIRMAMKRGGYVHTERDGVHYYLGLRSRQ